MKKLLILIFGFLAISSTAKADINDYFGQTITSVKLSETSAADSFLVLNSSGLIPGETLTAGKIQDGIKKIYALGIFSDVIIEAEKSSGGVDLLLRLEPYPRLSEIRFNGNKKIKDKTLRKEITINKGRIVSPGTIKSNVELIKKIYEEKGYLKAEIESDVVPDEKDSSKAILTFHVNEGAKVKVRNISFIGNTHIDDGKLCSKMSTKQKSFFRSGSFDREKYREDKQKIIDFYKKEGFIDAIIIADTLLYIDRKNIRYSAETGTTFVAGPDLFIKIYVDEGKQYYFGEFTWEGNEIIPDKKISSVFKVKDGQKYNQEKYDEMLFKLYETYQDEGYWYVQIDENKTPQDRKLDVHYSIVENQPVNVRMIHIEGNTKTKDKVIRRELKIKPNTVFKRSVLGRSLREVMVLNFFGNVTPDWNILDNGDIDLVIKVEEKPTGQFNIGAGYSARDKFVGTFGMGWPNFLGSGQTLTFDASIGKLRNTFSISYFEPWLMDTPTSLGISLYVQEREWYDWFTEHRRGGSIRVGRRLRWPDNYFKMFMSYRLEELKYYSWSTSYIENNADNPYSVDKTAWPQRTSVLSLSIERDSRNLAQFATKGLDIYWTGELGGTFLGGQWDYWKQVAGADFYYTPFWRFTFALKSKWGLTGGIYDRDKGVPYSERFTPGGTDIDGIIRGYDDSRIGPTTAFGGFIGGRSEAIYNLELVIPVAEQQFYTVLFADAGMAFLTGDELKDNFYRYQKLYKSVGFGFRVIAPMIGIIGFDFGIPLNGPEDEQGKLKPHFQIGRGF